MRQTHVAGEKLFVDFAGDTVPVIDPTTGEVRQAHVFVAVLGASNYTYAEARWSESLADWIGAHVHALAFIGGVPKLIVCDNLKAGVTTACRYEPGINRTYQDLAAHYGCSILPTRVRKPRDKAKVEAAVLVVERFILARLRNRRFFSLSELNAAIRESLGELNTRLMRKLGASRREFFATIDQPALLPLPAEPYRYAEWKKCRVAPDYHVELHGHFYSVPLPADPPSARRTPHRGHRRAVPSGQAGRGPSALAGEEPPHHRARPHAERAPPLCQLDPGQGGELCRRDRASCRGTGGSDHVRQAASRAGLPSLSRHPAPRPDLWRRAARGRLQAWAVDRRHDLRLDRLDPQERPRPRLP